MNGPSLCCGTSKDLPELGLRTQGHHAAIRHVGSPRKPLNLYMYRVLKDGY